MLANEIAAVILAAGGSSRFALPKQLVQFRGKSLLRRIVDATAEAKCSPVVVVIGSETEKSRDELAGASAIAVETEEWDCGIGTSIRAGVQGGIDNATKATVLLTCDQPLVEG